MPFGRLLLGGGCPAAIPHPYASSMWGGCQPGGGESVGPYASSLFVIGETNSNQEIKHARVEKTPAHSGGASSRNVVSCLEGVPTVCFLSNYLGGCSCLASLVAAVGTPSQAARYTFRCATRLVLGDGIGQSLSRHRDEVRGAATQLLACLWLGALPHLWPCLHDAGVGWHCENPRQPRYHPRSRWCLRQPGKPQGSSPRAAHGPCRSI